MADTMDSKSIVLADVWVRLPPPVFDFFVVMVRHERVLFVH